MLQLALLTFSFSSHVVCSMESQSVGSWVSYNSFLITGWQSQSVTTTAVTLDQKTWRPSGIWGHYWGSRNTRWRNSLYV